MHRATKEQNKRLNQNIQVAKAIKKAEGKNAPTQGKSSKDMQPPKKKGGFFASLIEKVFGRADKPQTAQQSIPYQQMYRDGICFVGGKFYTKTISFGDITYHLAQPEEQTQIIEKYCDFLNYFDSTVHVQLSAINRYCDTTEMLESIQIPKHGDENIDSLCEKYSGILESQHAKGNNGRIRTKYVTFGINADNLKVAKLRLERIEADVLNNFKVLGVTAQPLNGEERLELLHGQFHPSGKDKFRFNWDDLPLSGLSTKDYISPTSFDFRGGRTFRMGEHHGAVSYLQILAPELNDRMLADFLDLDSALTVTLHIQSIDQSEAIKRIKSKLSDIEKMKLEEQMKAVKQGYDMDIMPPDLIMYSTEAKTLLEDLQSRNERLFLVTIMVLNTGNTKSKLENDVFAASGIAQKHNCALKRLEYQQEQGLMSSLTLGLNQIEINRGLTTSSTAIFIPFTTCELFQTGEALYYGLNALSNNLIMANRKRLRNPNVAVYGAAGSMKSRAYVRNMVFQCVRRGESLIITDPKSELFASMAEYLRDSGYIVKVFNLISPENSDSWNCLREIEGDNPEFMAQLFCDVVIRNTLLNGKMDPFWDTGAISLLKALCLYVVQVYPEADRNIGEVYKLLANVASGSDGGGLKAAFAALPFGHSAKVPFDIFQQASDNVQSGITIGLANRIQVFQIEVLRTITSHSNGIDLTLPGKEKCAYFCITSDQDSTFDFLSSLFLSFLFIKLVRFADSQPSQTLPVAVHLLADELANIGVIPDLTKKISTVRSRKISMSVIFQNIAQMKNRYPDDAWLEIIGNCDTQLFLGCTDEMTAKFISDRTGEVTIGVESMAKELTSMRITNYTPSHRETSSIGKRKLLTPDEVLRLPREDALVIFRGQKVLKVKKFDFTKHPESKKMRDCNARDYIPNWRVEKEQPKILKPKLPKPQPKPKTIPELDVFSNVAIPKEVHIDTSSLSTPAPPPKDKRRKPRKKAVAVEEDLKQDLKDENSDLNINEPYKTIGIDDLLADL